jgi:hypothetical protein
MKKKALKKEKEEEPEEEKAEEAAQDSGEGAKKESKSRLLGKKKNKAKKRNNLAYAAIISVLVIAILVAAYLPFRIYSPEYDFPIEEGPETSYVYNGFRFEKSIYGWQTKLTLDNELYKVDFFYGPESVEHIPVESGVNDLILSAEKIYVTTYPYYTSRATQAQFEIAKITSPRTDFATGMLNIPTMMTVTYFPEGREQKELVPADCFNATEEASVIKLVLGDTTAVYKDGLCIIVEAESEEGLVKAADRLAYNFLGIIKKLSN